jgi:pilus assembly protein FimV
MGRSIDPDNPLYRLSHAAAPGAQALMGAAAAAAVAGPITAQAAPEALQEGGEDALMAGDWRQEAGATAETAPVIPPSDLEWGDEAFATSLEAPQAAGETEAGLAIPEPEALPEAEAVVVSVAPEIEATLPEAMPDAVQTLSVEAPSLEEVMESLPELTPAVDLQLPMEEESQPEAVPVLDLSGIDLDLVSAEPPPAAEAVAEVEAPVDFEPTPAAIAAEPAVAAAPEATVVEPGEAAMDPELREEVNTKLDLARAYLEMGDREGAREILQEVLSEGDAGQKSEAGKLMAEAG